MKPVAFEKHVGVRRNRLGGLRCLDNFSVLRGPEIQSGLQFLWWIAVHLQLQ